MRQWVRPDVCALTCSWYRFQYEEALAASPYDYDTWFDYLKLEEGAGDVERTREVGREGAGEGW
jgi:hypothetical protein